MSYRTEVRVALYHRDNGRKASNTLILLDGEVPHDQAVARARALLEKDYCPSRHYLLNCIDLGNYSVEVVQR